MSETTFRLSASLKTHAGDVTELKLKPPRARSLIEHDDPFTIRAIRGENGEVESYEYRFNNKAVVKFASDMSGHDEIVLSDLSVSDFMGLRLHIKDVITGTIGGKDPSSPSAE